MHGHPNRAGWFQGSQVLCDPAPPPREHPYRLVLLGPPGVGKGTQAELLCDWLRACHLSTGDMFRAAQCESPASPALQTALVAMQRGELVSDELVISIVQERFNCLRCHGGFLLDGFPRTVKQAKALDELLAEQGVQLDAVLCYDLPLEEIVQRLSGRRTCSTCKSVFHIVNRPPATEGTCDHCQGQLIQRPDDAPDAIRVRMQAYEKATRPLTDFYEPTGKLVLIEASGEPQAIFDRTLRALHERVDQRQPALASQPHTGIARQRELA